MRSNVQLRGTVILDLWVLGLASCVAAMGIWKVRPWGFFCFFGFVLGVLSGDLHHIIQNPASVNMWDFIDAIVASAGVILILQRHVTAPYFNPQIRWWETPSRLRVDLSATFTIGDKKVTAQILDVSESGCFVNLEAPNVVRGQMLNVGMSYEHYYFESSARVIRHSASPKGVGLKFEEMSQPNKREIKRLIKNLSKLNSRSRRPKALAA
jgi:hypothetical protein